jgi:glutamate transport system permease protein
VHVLLDHYDDLLKGMWVTLKLTGVSALIALLLGTVLAVMRVSPVPTLRGAGTAYVAVFRNTPLTLMLVFSVFGLPQLGLNLGFFTRAAIACSVYTAAFFCEAIRSGINAVPIGQAEAARAIGLRFRQVLTVVVLPQAFRASIPPLISFLIALTKNTAIAEFFGVAEATSHFDTLANKYESALYWLFAGVALEYVVVVLGIAGVGRWLEKRWRVLT